MSEFMTLQELGVAAQKDYARHGRAAAAQIEVEELKERRYLQPSYLETKATRATRRNAEADAASAEFFAAHAADLHDLAVIEAHLGGVTINVEQPLVIGERVEPPVAEAL